MKKFCFNFSTPKPWNEVLVESYYLVLGEVWLCRYFSFFSFNRLTCPLTTPQNFILIDRVLLLWFNAFAKLIFNCILIISDLHAKHLIFFFHNNCECCTFLIDRRLKFFNFFFFSRWRRIELIKVRALQWIITGI